MTVILVLSALALGYGIGVVGPWNLLGAWVFEQCAPRNVNRWTGSRVRTYILFALLAVTHPVEVVGIWRNAREVKRERRAAQA
ncbi:hypothetical protein [Streptomyces sp. CAU 1734]|uniref:hypothetical protein n=1 Tax=Streptomyces sp. CAU 1734 TaxID=3140360 RepID=UPI003260A044